MSLNAEIIEFQTGLASVDSILGRQVSLDFTGEGLQGGELAVRKAELAGEGFKLDLAGVVSPHGHIGVELLQRCQKTGGYCAGGRFA